MEASVVSIEQMYPPGNIADFLASPKAPVLIDGGFLFNSDIWDGVVPEGVIVPVNVDGMPMSPIDARTGVTLPIVASLEGKRPPNRHHAHFYKYLYANASLGLQAARYSRLQLVGAQPHTTYHQTFYGTAFPESPESEFAVTILNSAGFIPQCGVRVGHRKITIGELTTLERKKLRKPNIFTTETHLAAQATIGKFLMQSALAQDFSQVEQLHVEEFLEITDELMRSDDLLRASKLRLAVKLTNKALGMAVRPINSEFQAARKTHSLRQNTPPTPWEVAKQHIDGHEPDYVWALERRLAEYAQTA